MTVVCIYMFATYYVYIITNTHNTVLYVGLTNNLDARISEHIRQENPKSFSARYNLHKLVYFEEHEFIKTAIRREKYIKGKNRKWKVDLIMLKNPEWKDLTDTL